MEVHVFSTSGPSWQPIKDGKPYNKWVGTVRFSEKNPHGINVFYYGTVTADTKEKAEAKLAKYKNGDVVNISESKLTYHRHKKVIA